MSASRGTGAAILRREVLALRRAVCAYEAGTTFDVDQETSEAIDRAFDWHNPDGRVGSADHHLPELEAALRTPTPDPPSEGYKIEATVREKGLRPAIENGLYYWTDLDPHDDEAWVVDALVEAAREIVSAPPPVEEGEAQAWFRATECNQPPVSVPHSEAAAHGAPICPSCSSVTCMVRTASPPVEEGERGAREPVAYRYRWQEERGWRYVGHRRELPPAVEAGLAQRAGRAEVQALYLAAPDARQEERPWAGPPMMHESDCPYSFAHQGEGEPGDAELLLLAEQWCRGDVKGGRSAASQDDLEAAADAIRRLRAPQGSGERIDLPPDSITRYVVEPCVPGSDCDWVAWEYGNPQNDGRGDTPTEAIRALTADLLRAPQGEDGDG